MRFKLILLNTKNKILIIINFLKKSNSKFLWKINSLNNSVF